jgi:hypothetical protein
VTLGSTLSVANAVTLGSTLSVTGITTMASSLVASSTLSVADAVTLGSTLSVFGVATFHSDVIIEGSLQVTAGMSLYGTSNFVTTASDRRLKKNIKPIKDSLLKVTKIRGVYYNWISDEHSGLDFDNKRHVGVIAQEVQKILPEVVDKLNDSNFLGVNYEALVPLLIEAIRELNVEQELSKRTISQLSHRIELLEKCNSCV